MVYIVLVQTIKQIQSRHLVKSWSSVCAICILVIIELLNISLFIVLLTRIQRHHFKKIFIFFVIFVISKHNNIFLSGQKMVSEYFF